uniref:Adhesion G-protein coupled receptor G7-like n=1 Tax=Phallusia mammillata TaxID=59560 RepID=A0A6F9D6K1_9ASCI|nr:adhesion G-protein coupled receptor G7-like [Phallusia mammillata]
MPGGNRTDCNGEIIEEHYDGHVHYWTKPHEADSHAHAEVDVDKLFSSLETLSTASITQARAMIGNICKMLESDFELKRYDESHQRKRVVKAMDTLVDIVDLGNTGQLTINEHIITFQVHDVDLDTNDSHVGFEPPANTSEVLFDIPLNSIRSVSAHTNQSTARVGFVLYKNADLFSSSNFTTNQVIAATIRGNEANSTLAEAVSFSFSSISNATVKKALTCGFWDFNTDNWSTKGCRLIQVTNQAPKCECDHLTNFAILVDINRHDTVENAGSHDHANSPTAVVDYIGDVGCVLSIIGLTLTVIIHVSFKSLRRRRPQIILTHLSVSLLFAYTIFFFGISATKHYVVCALVTVMLHYFWLASWCWMAVEGYTMYTLLVKVLIGGGDNRYILKSCLFAYGLPFVIVSASAGYTLFYKDVETWENSHKTEIHKILAENSQQLAKQHYVLTGEAPMPNDTTTTEKNWESSYVGNTVCWPHGFPLYFGFLLPVGLIMLFNVGTFALILNSVTKGRRKVQSTAKKQTLMQQLSNLITMSVLLGLSWCFGFLAMISSNPLYLDVMHSIHTILTSIQGFVVFVLFCVRHTVVRKTWTKPILECLPFVNEPKTEASNLSRNYPCLSEDKHHHHRHSGNRYGSGKERNSVISQPGSSSGSSKRKSLTKDTRCN